MELRQYGRILLRRGWLVIVMLLAVLAVSLIAHRPPAPSYQASMRFAIGIEGSEPVSAAPGEGRSDAWLASEYLADDLAEVLKGGDFAAKIGERVGFAVPAGAIAASRAHRILSVTIVWGDPAQLQTIAESVAALVGDISPAYFPQLSGAGARAVLIDGPGLAPVGLTLRQKLDLPLRLMLAVVAGVALVFLWEYLDDSVHDRADLEALGPRVLGEIPRPRPFWRRPG